jgi:DNA-binding NarL/FixJ family response regulator
MPSRKLPTLRLKVLIVDDHPAAQEALAYRMRQTHDLECCGAAADLAGALKLAVERKPDCVVIDIGLKQGNGIDLIKRIKTRDHRVRILVWTLHDEELYAERALHAGAHGYISKRQATDRVVSAIRRVLSGKIYLTSTLTEKLLKRATHGSQGRSAVNLLSDQELEVFRRIGQGLDTKSIASQLHLSPKTVATYSNRVRQKLVLRDRQALLRFALQWAAKMRD